MPSTLVSRNVTVAGHRTSMRLEPAMWDALVEVCRRERWNIHQICTSIDANRSESSLTAALRVFIMDYFRAAATEDGHVRAGHGLAAAQRPIETFAAAAAARAGGTRVAGGNGVARISVP